jgi:xylan 1,4-beta-xylosidase
MPLSRRAILAALSSLPVVASAAPTKPLYFTEWSTSYTPRDSAHDSYVSAAYIVEKLRRTQGLVQGMSYWTYTDLFEEPGPPTKPFEGGFGLMSPQSVRKPAWFAYKYLNAVRGQALACADDQVFAARDGGRVTVLAYAWRQPNQKVRTGAGLGLHGIPIIGMISLYMAFLLPIWSGQS